MNILPSFIVFQVALILTAGLFVLGYRLALLPFKLFFLGFAFCLLVAALAAFIGVLFSFWGKVSLPGFYKMLSLIIGLGPIVFIVLSVGKAGFSVPPIHNITTNLANPPAFNQAYTHRGASSNPLEPLQGETLSVHQQYYKELKPLISSLPASQAYELSLATAKQLGWQVYYQDDTQGVFEAYEQTALLGFKDDIVVRVIPIASGSQIDLRSVSRVGKSDLGANAKRIRAFIRGFSRE